MDGGLPRHTPNQNTERLWAPVDNQPSSQSGSLNSSSPSDLLAQLTDPPSQSEAGPSYGPYHQLDNQETSPFATSPAFPGDYPHHGLGMNPQLSSTHVSWSPNVHDSQQPQGSYIDAGTIYMQPYLPPPESSMSISPPPSELDVPLDPTAEEKRRRNTAASAKFRIKKKQQTMNLEQSVSDLAGRAQELEREAAELRRENGWLKEIVMMKGNMAALTAKAGSSQDPKSESVPVARGAAQSDSGKDGEGSKPGKTQRKSKGKRS